MRNKLKQCIASLLAVIMVCLVTYSPVPVKAELLNQQTDLSNQDIVTDNYTMESTNSFGNLLLKELQPVQEQQEENNGYNIFSVEVVEKTATAAYETQEDCTLVVGIYDEAGVKLLASGTADVKAEEKVAEVTIETDTMPTYFYVKAYLIDTDTLRPLNTVYECPNYTQEMQEFLEKTTDDFDEELVLNLDEDKTNNFAVYLDTVNNLTQSETQNIISVIEGESQTTVIEQADEMALSLQPGDIYTYAIDGELFFKQVTDVVVDGSTVTITDTDAEIEQVFDYMKIDTTSDLSEATYDPSTKDPDLIYLGDEEEAQNSIDTGDIENDRESGSDSKKEKFKFPEGCDVSGDFVFSLENGIKVHFFDNATHYVEFVFNYKIGFSVSFKGKTEITVSLGAWTLKPIAGVYVSLNPGIIFGAEAKLELSDTFGGKVGCRVIAPLIGAKRVENISEKPEFKPEIELQGKVYVGIVLKPKVTVISDKIVYIQFESKIIVEATVKLDMDHLTNDKIKHDCNACFIGNIKGKWDISFEIQLFNMESLTLDAKLMNLEFDIADFHYSADNNEFSFSECPHKNYQVKVIVLEPDGDKEKLLPDATINDTYKTDSNGMITLWLPKGEHMITAHKDGYKSQTKKVIADERGTGTFFILEKDGSVKPIEPNDDISGKLSLGTEYSALITEDGNLYTWGNNYFGGLGNGTTTDSSTPIKIMENVKQVSLGWCHSAAITEEGDLYTWGHNDEGQLGNGTTTDSYTPIKIMENVKQVSLGREYSAAITEDGSLYMWGNNEWGYLGNGTTEDSNTPIKIMGNVKQVSSGWTHSAAITEDGSLYIWGANWNMQLGNGTTESSSTPIKIMENVKQVSLGGYHSAVITEEGSLYIWGYNSYGQLGNGTTTNSSTPIKIMENVKLVSLGCENSSLITEDGNLYMWGYNRWGQLGNGTTTNSSTPIKIMENVKLVSLEYNHSAAIKEDGDLYTWGCNDEGQLGNGTTTSSSTPIKIMNIGTYSTDTIEDIYNSEAITDTALQPDSVYNLYVMRSKSSENPFSADNLLYIGQGTTDAQGELSLEYEPKEVDENAVTFAVCMKPYDIADAETDMTDLIYTGEEQLVNFNVKYNRTMLVEGTDYQLSGDVSATEPGTYTVTITGIGLYSGSKDIVYNIIVPEVKVTSITLSHTALTLLIGETLPITATVLPEDATNKELEITSLDPSVATVTEDGVVTAISTGTTNVVFTANDGSGVTKKCFIKVCNDISTAKVKFTAKNYAYKPAGNTPVPTVTIDGTVLKKGTDYTVKYSNNINPGTATVTITGIGKYRGTAKGYFRINPPATKFTSVLNGSSYIYLKWNKSEGARGYYIYRSDNGGAYKKIKTISSGSTLVYYDKNNISNGVRYKYKIVACYSASNVSAPSAYKDIYRVNKAVLTGVTNKAAKTMTVSWKRIYATTGYQVRYATKSDFSDKTYVYVSGGSKVTTSIKNLVKGKKYYVSVRAVKKANGTYYYGAWSSPMTVTVDK